MCVMTRLILSQCVQTLVRRISIESSRHFKHIKVNPVPGGEQQNADFDMIPTRIASCLGI
jgi:hypothetical protein